MNCPLLSLFGGPECTDSVGTDLRSMLALCRAIAPSSPRGGQSPSETDLNKSLKLALHHACRRRPNVRSCRRIIFQSTRYLKDKINDALHCCLSTFSISWARLCSFLENLLLYLVYFTDQTSDDACLQKTAPPLFDCSQSEARALSASHNHISKAIFCLCNCSQCSYRDESSRGDTGCQYDG